MNPRARTTCVDNVLPMRCGARRVPRLQHAFWMRLLLSVVLLCGLTACNDRRSTNDLRNAIADAAEPGGAETGDVMLQDATERDGPADAGDDSSLREDGSPDAPVAQDADPPDADARADVSDASADDVEQDGEDDVTQWVEEPCVDGTVGYNTRVILNEGSDDERQFSSLFLLDVDGDGEEDLLSSVGRQLVRVLGPSDPRAEVAADAAAGSPLAAGMFRDTVTGQVHPSMAFRFRDGLHFRRAGMEDGALTLTALAESWARPDAVTPWFVSGAFAGGRFFAVSIDRIDGQPVRHLDELTLHDGVLESRPCATVSGALSHDPQTGRVWTWLSGIDSLTEFAWFDPAECGELVTEGPAFAGLPASPPVVAHHDDGRIVVAWVDDAQVTLLIDDTVEHWELTLPVESDPQEARSAAVVRAPGSDRDLVLSSDVLLDLFDRTESPTYGGISAVQAPNGFFVASVFGGGLVWRTSAENHEVLVRVGGEWWDRYPGPASLVNPYPRLGQLQSLYRSRWPYAGAAMSGDPHGLEEIGSFPGLTGVGALSTSVDRTTYRKGFAAWQIADDNTLGAQAPTNETPLSFGSVWASGIADGVIDSVIYYSDDIWSPGAADYRPALPTGLVWADAPGVRPRVGTGSPVLESLRVVRDAVDVDRWYVVGRSAAELVWLEIDIDGRRVTPVTVFARPGVADPRFIEPVGDVTNGIVAVGDGERIEFLRIRDGITEWVNAVSVSFGESVSDESWIVPWSNGPHGGTLVNAEGDVLAVNVDGTVQQLEGLPPAASASRGDFNGDGKLDVLLSPHFALLTSPNGYLFFGRCEQP